MIPSETVLQLGLCHQNCWKVVIYAEKEHNVLLTGN